MPETDKINDLQDDQKNTKSEEKVSDLSLSTLPQEIIEKIFSHLSVGDIGRISRSSSFFKKIADKDAIWREQAYKDFGDLLEFFEKGEKQTWLAYYKKLKQLTEKYGSTKLLIKKLRKAKEYEDNLTVTLSETFKLRMTGKVLAYNEIRQLFAQHLEFYIELVNSGHKEFGLKLAKLLMADRLYVTHLATREHHRTLKEILESLIEQKFHVEECEYYLYDYFADMTADIGLDLEEEEIENEDDDINKYYSPKNKLFFRDAFTKALMKETDFISYVFAHGERAVNLVAMHLLDFINIGYEVDTAKILLNEIEEKRKNNFQMSKEEQKKMLFSFRKNTRTILNPFDNSDALRQEAATKLGLDKPPEIHKLLGLRPDSPGPRQAMPLDEILALNPALAGLLESEEESSEGDDTSSGSEKFASDSEEESDADSPKP